MADEQNVRLSVRRAGRRVLAGALAAAVASTAIVPAMAQTNRIEFWTQPYGDLVAWKKTMADLAAAFQKESGIEVRVEPVNWSTAFQTWLAVARGGTHPDCADMYWLYSFQAIGGDKAGPAPMTQFQQANWPTLKQDYLEAGLQDVFWKGDFYGIPWRGDIRNMVYRSDALAEAGIAQPPDTWDEIVDQAKKLTKRDARGNITRYGFTPGGATNNAVTGMIPYYWQAGGRFMTEDGRTATIDNEAMRKTLGWLRDLVWVHKVVPPELMEKGFDPLADFVSGKIAIVGSAANQWGVTIDRDYPEMKDKWMMAISAKGPVDRSSFSGAGYFGVLQGSKNVEGCAKWIKFLSADANMQRLSEASGNVSPKKVVMDSAFWSDRPWKRVVRRALDDARTSQHPTPAWSTIAAPEPGAVLYDMMYDVVIRQKDVDTVVKAAQVRMQAEMDRAAPQK